MELVIIGGIIILLIAGIIYAQVELEKVKDVKQEKEDYIKSRQINTNSNTTQND